jgi:hypothetical protein
MAEIASPMSSAMKARGKAAIDAINEASHNYASRTPRELRALILRQDDSDPIRAAMIVEGWFETAPGDGNTWKSATNTAVDVS